MLENAYLLGGRGQNRWYRPPPQGVGARSPPPPGRCAGRSCGPPLPPRISRAPGPVSTSLSYLRY